MERPCDPERWRCTPRNLQIHVEENTSDQAVAFNRGTGQLRSCFERVLLRPASWRLRSSIELLSYGKTSLPNRCLRATFRGGTRLLGSGL